jgi:hypothetical protein
VTRASVGFKQVRLHIVLDTDATPDERARLLELTKRYCVVYQTLCHGSLEGSSLCLLGGVSEGSSLCLLGGVSEGSSLCLPGNVHALLNSRSQELKKSGSKTSLNSRLLDFSNSS